MEQRDHFGLGLISPPEATKPTTILFSCTPLLLPSAFALEPRINRVYFHCGSTSIPLLIEIPVYGEGVPELVPITKSILAPMSVPSLAALWPGDEDDKCKSPVAAGVLPTQPETSVEHSAPRLSRTQLTKPTFSHVLNVEVLPRFPPPVGLSQPLCAELSP